MRGDTCSICGGEGRITGPYNRTAVCPGCNGSGRQSFEPSGLRDVTKTKPSHYRTPEARQEAEKQTWPATFEGAQLATEVRDCTTCDDTVKARLIREIIEYEGSHGTCTKTFVRKVRKQIRP